MKAILSGKMLLLQMMSRKGMMVFNILIMVVSLFSGCKIFELAKNLVNNMVEVDNILNSVATIFIAYGVALEERETIFRLFGISHYIVDQTEENLNHLCHEYGLLFLVVGLFIEVTSEVVKIPEAIFQTPYTEETMALTGISMMLYLMVKLMVFSVKLTRQRTSTTDHKI